MKGKVYCLSNSSLENIYMIGTDVYPEEKLLKEISDKNIKTEFKCEYSVECNNAISKEITIRKLLKDYKYEKKKRFFNIDLETIIKIFKDLDTLDELQKDKEALRLRNENLKIQNVIKYINENIEHIENINNEILDPNDDRSIKIDVLHEDYIIYCRKEGIVPNLRAGICDFEKICEKHTSIGKLSEDFEFNFVKFRILPVWKNSEVSF
jgi:hypothetical protein